MTKMEEELYVETIYSILTNLKGKISFFQTKIPFDNIELVISKSSIDGINQGDFTISFQKQNGSFTLITNKKISDDKTKIIVNLISESCGNTPFASYNFVDMKDILISQWCYDEEKIEFNRGILEEYKRQNQIENLKYIYSDDNKIVMK